MSLNALLQHVEAGLESGVVPLRLHHVIENFFRRLVLLPGLECKALGFIVLLQRRIEYFFLPLHVRNQNGTKLGQELSPISFKRSCIWPCSLSRTS